jgi:myo-inositol-1(or 4)-monophosphatase
VTAPSATDPADAAFAREVAEAAGRILVERYERVEVIDYKSARDVVTEVDHLSEAMILDAIRKRFPGDAILAEESGAHPGPAADTPTFPGTAKVTKEARAAEAAAAEAAIRGLAHGRTWVIDPLDGTINYANGIPYFCVSVALVVDGVPTVGAVHDPMRGETFWAPADGPAMLGETPIRASRKAKLSDAVVSMALGGRAVATRARAVRKVVRASRNTGSAALALAYVANGRFDAFVQTGGMSAWDVAAAGLIAERGGALVTNANGGPWFDVERATRAFGIVAAPVAHHAELLARSREAAGTEPRSQVYP